MHGAFLPGVFFGVLVIFLSLLTCWTTYDYIYVNKMKFSSMHYGYELGRIMFRYFMGYLGIALSFFIVSFLCRFKLKEVLIYIGMYSLDIYLIQRYVVEGIYPRILSRAHIHLDSHSALFLLAIAPVAVFFFVFICVAITKSVLRKNDLLARLFLGGRV